MRAAVVFITIGLLSACGKKVDVQKSPEQNCYDVTVIASSPDGRSTLVEQYTAHDGKKTRFHRNGYFGNAGESFQLCDLVLK